MEYNNNLYSSRTTKKINYYKLLKIIKKTNFPENFAKNIYRPINPSHPFNYKDICPNEIAKKKNSNLIINNKIKDIINKYNKSKRQKSNEIIKNNNYLYYKYKDEEQKYYLALKSILKKDFNHLPKFLTEEKDNNKKKKINLKINISRNRNKLFEKVSLNNKSLGFNNTTSQIKHFKTEIGNFEKTHPHRLYINTDKIENKKDFLINKFKSVNLNNKLSIIRKRNNKNNIIRNYQLRNINNLNIKKQLSFAITNMISAKLGKISIFGVFEDNGIYGKMISSIIINYLIEYFEKCKEMVICLEKNNFYSILHWSFVNAQKYLINNANKFNIDLYNSGCMGCFLFIPKNNNNIFYCANVGKCKCILYTNRGTDILCFPTNIERISERERIFNIIKKKNLEKIEKNLNKENNIKANIKKDENKNENKIILEEVNHEKENITKLVENNYINNQIIKEEIKTNEFEEEKIDRDKYINYFKEIEVTRCFGNISGEEMGLSPEPEVTECDIRANKVKFAVLGNTIFWKYLDEKEVRFIVSKYLNNNDTVAASKELEELIKQKVGISSKVLIDSSFVVVYFDTIV